MAPGTATLLSLAWACARRCGGPGSGEAPAGLWGGLLHSAPVFLDVSRPAVSPVVFQGVACFVFGCEDTFWFWWLLHLCPTWDSRSPISLCSVLTTVSVANHGRCQGGS